MRGCSSRRISTAWRERGTMCGVFGLGHGVAPFRGLEIDVLPCSSCAVRQDVQRRAGARRRAQRTVNVPSYAVHRPQNSCKLFGFRGRCEVCSLEREAMRHGGPRMIAVTPAVSRPHSETPYRHLPLARCAVSRAPTSFQFAASTPNNSFAVISEIGRPPIQGKCPVSKRRTIRSPWLSAQFVEYSGKPLARHHLEAVRFSIPLCRLWRPYGFGWDQLPLATRLRISSRRPRAIVSPVSGYTPRESRFSFPPNRYFRRHHLPPAGEISRYSPRSSNSLLGFLPGFALRMAVSVRGMGATPDGSTWACPQLPPAVNGRTCTSVDRYFV